MDPYVRYLHKLEQIAGELRTTADNMQKLSNEIERMAAYGTESSKLREMYHNHLRKNDTNDLVDRLNTLVENMKHDESILPKALLEDDLVTANAHALRLCQIQLGILRIMANA